jgi:hypothetical protein
MDVETRGREGATESSNTMKLKTKKFATGPSTADRRVGSKDARNIAQDESKMWVQCPTRSTRWKLDECHNQPEAE